ncbi:MAG: glycosyltransferase, partial [Victivallaceae bacterium]
MNDLKFSVAMSVYKNDNAEQFKNAVDSILNQTVIPDEVVLVVDGPIPNELDRAVNAYEANEIFKVIRLPENGGLGNALKICVENSRNE